MQIRNDLTAASLQSKIDRLWQLSAEKINLISKEYDNSKGTPVFHR
jgi:unsaturated chondroitin disaccharide hydrolase